MSTIKPLREVLTSFTAMGDRGREAIAIYPRAATKNKGVSSP
ncbi:MAG: hypothetical protein ACP5IL_14240 [Syntrophobacteraceae bacterium]